MLAIIAPHDAVWDCATGSGQAAVPLAQHFPRVLATDASRTQLASAERAPGVRYLCAAAEAAPLASQSVSLVTVAQALHWFALDRFYAEVRRVLRPGGILAAWSYGHFSIGDTPIEDRMRLFYDREVAQDWPPERCHVDAGYETLPFPLSPIVVPGYHAMVTAWTLKDVIGYVRTWSAVERYRRRTGHDPVERLATDLQALWGDPDVPRTVRWPLAIRLGAV